MSLWRTKSGSFCKESTKLQESKKFLYTSCEDPGHLWMSFSTTKYCNICYQVSLKEGQFKNTLSSAKAEQRFCRDNKAIALGSIADLRRVNAAEAFITKESPRLNRPLGPSVIFQSETRWMSGKLTLSLYWVSCAEMLWSQELLNTREELVRGVG